jgi:hypothetical protein
MDEPRKILTIHIGQNDIYEWTMNVGKERLMPELLVGCEELLYNDLDEVLCVRVESLIRGKQKAFDFSVKQDGVTDTLEKIMEWALETEEYEMCTRVKNLFEYIEKNKFTI